MNEEQLDKPYNLIRSSTPQERRAERDQADVARLQATQKGTDGISVHQRSVIKGDAGRLGNGANGGAAPELIAVEVSGCLNGAPATGLAAYFSPPQ